MKKETMGSYFAKLAKEGRLNEVNRDELQEIMQNQANRLGFTGISVSVVSEVDKETESKEKED